MDKNNISLYWFLILYKVSTKEKEKDKKKCKFYRSSLKERQNSDFTESIHSGKTN